VTPQEAPRAVRLAIVPGNLLHTRRYPQPGVHHGSMASLWPAYDYSGAGSLGHYAAGRLGPTALDSGSLESHECRDVLGGLIHEYEAAA
jgi:hypothetical protein